MKAVVATGLFLRFLWAVVLSGIDTIKVIVRATVAPERTPRAGFVRFRYAPMSDRGATVLAAMITLTPGTTAIDIDPETRIMTLHLLDLDGAEGAIADVRRVFEPPLVILCGEPR